MSTSRRNTSTRRPARAARRRRPALFRNPGWQLRALKRLQALGAGGRQRNPKGDPHLGSALTGDEIERVQALLEDGFTLLLQPLADQVVIATVDLEKITALIGDPRAALH